MDERIFEVTRTAVYRVGDRARSSYLWLMLYLVIDTSMRVWSSIIHMHLWQ